MSRTKRNAAEKLKRERERASFKGREVERASARSIGRKASERASDRESCYKLYHSSELFALSTCDILLYRPREPCNCGKERKSADRRRVRFKAQFALSLFLARSLSRPNRFLLARAPRGALYYHCGTSHSGFPIKRNKALVMCSVVYYFFTPLRLN